MFTRDRRNLALSIERQSAVLDGSLVLTPVDNFPALSRFGASVDNLHGLYASDKDRSEQQQKEAVIQFAGRKHITADINAIHASLADAFSCDHASLRLLSGLHAHIVLFMGLSEIGAKVALLPSEGGGHFATPRILERLGLNVLPLPIDINRRCVDVEASLRMLKHETPDILFVDRSEGLRYEDFARLGQSNVPIKIFDSSQYAAQIVAGLYTNPFDWGFNLQILTLHKSFPGPQKAAVLSNDHEVWQTVLGGLSDFVSSSHIENSYFVGLVLAQREALFDYANRLVEVKTALENELLQVQIPVLPSSTCGDIEWPATQHLWITLKDADSAFAAWKSLESNRIQTNYRKLPYNLGWGLRLGVTAAVSRGLLPDDTPELASIIRHIFADPHGRKYRKAVTALARRVRSQAPFEQLHG